MSRCLKARFLASAAFLLLAAPLFAQSSALTAHAAIVDSSGKSIGTATLTESTGGVRITAALTGLPPGTHGIHIHSVGKCEAPGFTSAGGHFNPDNKQHGMKNPMGAHAGDLPNFDVAADGTASLSLLAAHVTLGGGPTSLFHDGGTALVIHANGDDYMTDPSGNSGARIACGVIQK
jgi:Cu-Zn family superoxide dismutase